MKHRLLLGRLGRAPMQTTFDWLRPPDEFGVDRLRKPGVW